MPFSTLLDRRLTLQRQQLTSDASGGTTRTFVDVLTLLPCAIAPASAGVVADYARRDMIVNHHVYTTADLDGLIAGGVRLGDRIADGGVIYLVKAVLRSANTAVSAEVVYQLDCERRIV